MFLRSIASRLFVISAAWLIIALVATAMLLTALYARALDRQLSDALEFNLQTLVADALSIGEVRDVKLLAADPRFERVASGWYWQVRGPDGDLVNASTSLVGSVLPAVATDYDDEGRRTGTAHDDFGISIRVFERRITLPSGDYEVAVTGNLDENTALTDAFRSQALLVLAAVGVALAMMSAIVGRIALRPVNKLRDEMENVRDGAQQAIAGQYPSELAPLAREVNELLHSNQQIVERARAQVGNLAHGLKTPIAVLRNEAEADQSELSRVVGEQSDRMNDIVSAYLERAQMAARTAVVGKKTDASKVLTRLHRVMKKLHPEKDVVLSAQANVWFRGEEADFEEMAGNLAENACKWAASRVEIRLAGMPENRRILLLQVDDDGPGLSAEQRQAVLKRGVRLDERVRGSGLGLDIVKELVDIYGGDIKLSQADLGGLRVRLELPAAKSPSS